MSRGKKKAQLLKESLGERMAAFLPRHQWRNEHFAQLRGTHSPKYLALVVDQPAKNRHPRAWVRKAA